MTGERRTAVLQGDQFRAMAARVWMFCMAGSAIGGQSADQYYTADDDEARTTAATLIAASGLRPIFTGGSDRVSVVDGITHLWFTLAFKQDLGRHIGFHRFTDTSNP